MKSEDDANRKEGNTGPGVTKIPSGRISAPLGALQTDDWGGLKVDRHQMTSEPGVFAGGDDVRGTSLVVHAVRDARKAAQGIHHDLSGAGRG